MKILLVCDYFPPEKVGGVGEIVRNLRNEYRASGHSAHVLTTGTGSDPGCGVHRTGPNLILGVIRNNWHIIRLIRALDIDVVHLHQASTTLFLLLRLVGCLRPVIVISSYQVSYVEEMKQVRKMSVDGIEVRPTFGEFVEKYVFGPIHVVLDTIGYQLADVVTAVSSETRLEISRSYGRLRAREVSVVSNGCEPAIQGEQVHDAEFEEQLVARKVVLSLGVFRMRKRLVNLLIAFRELVREHIPAVLVLVGGGRGYEQRLAHVAQRLGIAEHVIATGPVPHHRVAHYFNRADLLCVPSSYEGMPVTILEAMAAGCVVVTSDASGMRDLIEDGQTGFLVPVDDVHALAQTLKEVLEDSELRHTVRVSARMHVHQNYSWDKIAASYLQLVPS